MSYQETIKYLESFIDYEKTPSYPYKESLKLERIRNFLDFLADPQDSLRCIHVAGSKGKGSTCAFITYILRQAGYKVGLYTSPHLSDFRERIRILECQSVRVSECQAEDEFEGMISADELAALVSRIRPVIERYNRDSEYGPLTFFEVYTGLALLYFKEQGADFAVLETGLGGRLDATNVVTPLVSAITPISYEHTQKLGNTLKEIAGEKAGIIKPQTAAVISAPQEEEAMAIIRRRCAETGAKLYEVNKDIVYKKSGGRFTVKGVRSVFPDLRVRLLGEHQVVNATVAVAVVEALDASGIKAGIGAIRSGLEQAAWPGRCEVILRNPLVVLDGAQNAASAGALKAAIKESFRYARLFLVLGVSSDKDIAGICGQLRDLADEVILTRAENPRALEPELLVGNFAGKKIHLTRTVAQARELACGIARNDDLVLVTGSLFVAGEFRDAQKRYQ